LSTHFKRRPEIPVSDFLIYCPKKRIQAIPDNISFRASFFMRLSGKPDILLPIDLFSLPANKGRKVRLAWVREHTEPSSSFSHIASNTFSRSSSFLLSHRICFSASDSFSSIDILRFILAPRTDAANRSQFL